MIVKTITDDYYFWNWIKNSDTYNNNFSLEGAKAVQAYLDEYSEETGESIEFDPVAWCVEFSEYDSLKEAWHELVDYKGNLITTKEHNTDEKRLEYFQDRATVIELDNGHVIISEY